MFGPQIAALRFTLKSMARRATWSTLGGILILFGALLFGIAGWIVLARVVGVVAALLIAGLVLIGLGIFAMAWSRYPPRVVPRQTAEHLRNPMHSPPLTVASILNAVVMGIAAGRSVRRRD